MSKLYPEILDPLSDFAADKAYSIGKRGVWRDYVDIFFLLKRKIFTLKEIIHNAQKKYKPEFNPRLFLEQLSYFGDIHDFQMVLLKEKYTVEDVKTFLIGTVKKSVTPPYKFLL